MRSLMRDARTWGRRWSVTAATFFIVSGCGSAPSEKPENADRSSSRARATLASTVIPTPGERLEGLSLAERARRDPRGLLQLALKRCRRQIRDYVCTFTRQERIRGALTEEQVIRVRFREEPFSAYMVWMRNASRVRRALFVEGRNVGKNGEQMLLVEPAGVIARALFGTVSVPVNGRRARAASRHTMDHFGFRWTLQRIEASNERAAQAGVLDLRYVGTGSVHGRPTFILNRYLPETNGASVYPNAFLELHLDQEWLIPLSIRAYADHEGKRLIEAYSYRNVVLNPGLGEASFRF